MPGRTRPRRYSCASATVTSLPLPRVLLLSTSRVSTAPDLGPFLDLCSTSYPDDSFTRSSTIRQRHHQREHDHYSMNATSRSNSGTSHGADSRRISDRSICSSPLPGGDGDGDNGDQVMSSQYTAEPSLGVYFEKHDHEYNDVIAAFRVSKRIIEETIQVSPPLHSFPAPLSHFSIGSYFSLIGASRNSTKIYHIINKSSKRSKGMNTNSHNGSSRDVGLPLKRKSR